MVGLGAFYSKNKLNSLVLITVSLMNAVLYYSVANQLKYFFDTVVPSNNVSLVLKYLFILGGLYFGTFISGIFENMYFNKVTQTGSFSMKEDLILKLYKTDFEYFIQNNTGEVWSEINLITNQIAGFYRSLLELIVYVFHIVIYGTIIFGTSPVAGWLCLAILPIVFLMTFFVRNKLSQHECNMLTYLKKVNGGALESLGLVRVIKAKSEYQYFIAKFQKQYQKVIKEIVLFAVYNGYSSGFIGFITAIFPVFIIFVVMQFGTALSLSVGEIIIIYAFIPSFLRSFNSIYASLLTYYGTKPHLERYKHYSELSEENRGGVTEFDNLDITTEDLSCSFDSKVVRIPDMKICQGEKVLLVGESGIGKSTLFNILVGYRTKYSGKITIGNYDLKNIDILKLREQIGIAFQDNRTFEGTLRDNILISKNVDQTSYDKLVSEMMLSKLQEQLNESLINNDKLSGGEKARIQLAQTLIRNPKILLIDETLSSVDEEMEEKIIQAIMEKYQDATVIMISHRSQSRKYFDKVIEIKKDNELLKII